ncbi:MAG: adenosine deaminase [bacterium]|nr:adenosine deaminase [bacterium]
MRHLISGFLLLFAGAATLAAQPPSENPAASWLEAHRHRPTLVRTFVQRMPKGGDIHSHAGGAVYAERLIERGVELGMCLREDPPSIVPGPCDREQGPQPLERIRANPRTYGALIDALSTRNLAFSERSGHDQFFAVFSRFRNVVNADRGAVLAAIAGRAAREHVTYQELQIPGRLRAAIRLGDRIGFDGDFAATLEGLLAAGLDSEIEPARRELDELEARFRELLACDGPTPQPGCEVTLRYLLVNLRMLAPGGVFAQLAHSFALAQADPRIVGINLAAPEDERVALRDYRLHMEMVGFLRERYPGVGVTLHAGELTMGLVPPVHLRSHIRQAVEVAGAHRIGHGVAISYEDEAVGLLDAMRERDVLVEICLTSNDVILGVRGAEHPLPDYLAAGVPVTLASDDQGVSRIDLSHEYRRAALTYGLGYGELKQMARNSLSYSFLPGESLWRSGPELVDACRSDRLGGEKPSAACAAFLAASEKAALQWRLERQFHEFESLPWLRRNLSGREPDIQRAYRTSG